MAIAKFFIDQASVTIGDEVILSEQESHHAIKVRRMKQGDKVMLLNGVGGKLLGTIQQCNHKALGIRIESSTQSEPAQPVVDIAVALPKGDRQKTMLDMLAQLGVATITPLLCEFSVSKYSEKVVQRWERTLLEACKQSENPFLPQLCKAQTVQVFIEENANDKSIDNHFIYYADIKGKIASLLDNKDKHERVSILVGPEGGYSNSELSMLESKGISTLKLSNHILRIETAAVAAAAAFIR